MKPRQEPLRFGVMCSARGLTRFAETCICHLTRDSVALPVLLIVDASVPQKSTWRQKLKRAVRLEGNLWYAQNKLFPLHAIPAYQTRPLDESFPSLPRLTVTPQLRGRWSQHFPDQDLARIREYNLDFILKFAFGIVRGEVLTSARYGVWSYHHDDEERYRGGPPAFWEIYHGDRVTAALFQRLTDRLDGGVVLEKCWVATDPRSHRANLQRIQSSSAHLARWTALDITRGSVAHAGPPSQTNAPIFVAPNDWQMLRYWVRLAANWVRYKLHNQRVDEWNVGLFRGAPEQLLDDSFEPSVQWSGYREPGQMVADPFLIPLGDEPRVLVEEFDWRSERGRIAELRRGDDGTLNRITPAIDEDVHMSYPYSFVYDGALYCIPETGRARQIRLYRLEAQTGRWQLDRVLIDGIGAVDATLFEAFDSWWLFHGGLDGAGPWSLFLWQASSPFGPWTPHPANPVKTDVRSSRPAGRPFWCRGELYRPAQNGEVSYGGGLALNRIESLSLDNFYETTVRQIAPGRISAPYTDGIHTLNGYGGWTVIDAKRHTWPIALLAHRIARRFTGGKPRPSFQYRRMEQVGPRLPEMAVGVVPNVSERRDGGNFGRSRGPL